jgi:hypothetical protein
MDEAIGSVAIFPDEEIVVYRVALFSLIRRGMMFSSLIPV